MTVAAKQLEIVHDAPISTWFRVGGRADRYARPRGVDDLATRSGLDAGSVASMLLRLELEGRIRAVSGGLYQRR